MKYCDQLREFSSNLPYHFVITIKFALCLIGAFGVSFQWKRHGVRFLVHENTKAVFKLYLALNLFVACHYCLSYLFEIIRLRFECPVVNFRVILLTKGVGISAAISAHFLVVLISAERIYSAIFPERFEKQSSKKISYIASVYLIISNGSYTMYHFSNGFTLFGTHPVAFFEERIPENANAADELIFLGVISSVFSIVLFFFDVYFNFIRRTTILNPSLSITYQRSENRRVVLIILPIEIIQSLLGFATTSALMLQDKFIDTSNPIHRVLYREVFTFGMLLPSILAIIIEFRVARRVRTSVITKESAKEHFDSLRRAWEA